MAMAIAFFRVQLSVQPRAGGAAELVVPNVLQGLNYQFIIVKEGGEEGVVRVEASAADLEKIEKDQNCKKLTDPQMKELKNSSYPPPKLKQKYRLQTQAKSETEGISEPFVVDEQGNRVIDTWQTVRSGFYLIDVLVLTQ
jgi:hypothetical protein